MLLMVVRTTFAEVVDDEQRGNVEVQNVLESSINMCWNEIRHRATLQRNFSETPPVDANESRLGQVFLNLLINAVQAMPESAVRERKIPGGKVHGALRGWEDGGDAHMLTRMRRFGNAWLSGEAVYRFRDTSDARALIVERSGLRSFSAGALTCRE